MHKTESQNSFKKFIWDFERITLLSDLFNLKEGHIVICSHLSHVPTFLVYIIGLYVQENKA